MGSFTLDCKVSELKIKQSRFYHLWINNANSGLASYGMRKFALVYFILSLTPGKTNVYRNTLGLAVKQYLWRLSTWTQIWWMSTITHSVTLARISVEWGNIDVRTVAFKAKKWMLQCSVSSVTIWNLSIEQVLMFILNIDLMIPFRSNKCITLHMQGLCKSNG